MGTLKPTDRCLRVDARDIRRGDLVARATADPGALPEVPPSSADEFRAVFEVSRTAEGFVMAELNDGEKVVYMPTFIALRDGTELLSTPTVWIIPSEMW